MSEPKEKFHDGLVIFLFILCGFIFGAGVAVAVTGDDNTKELYRSFVRCEELGIPNHTCTYIVYGKKNNG